MPVHYFWKIFFSLCITNRKQFRISKAHDEESKSIVEHGTRLCWERLCVVVGARRKERVVPSEGTGMGKLG